MTEWAVFAQAVEAQIHSGSTVHGAAGHSEDLCSSEFCGFAFCLLFVFSFLSCCWGGGGGTVFTRLTLPDTFNKSLSIFLILTLNTEDKKLLEMAEEATNITVGIPTPPTACARAP